MTSHLANYSAFEGLRDGSRIEIRALRPDDRADFVAAVGQVSAMSLYRRFFGPKRAFSEKEVAFFTDVDFATQVALIAVTEEGGRPLIIGGGRYVLVKPGQAEIAFVVVDAHQGRGIGACLLRHLAAIARDAGLTELMAEVLAENTGMLKVFEKSGLRCQMQRHGGSVHVVLHLS
ncbi:MAG: GNAT family N-acetyltransferase [Pseudomonadota bacterium]